MAQPVVLSYGLGVDSTAILLRWLTEPASRDFDLRDLTVLTAMTGDEWDHTRELVERFVLPMLATNEVRYIQVARGGRYVSREGGIRVLSDTPFPTLLHLAGDYKLSQEMLSAGTVPQSGGARLCSVHAKGDVLDPVIKTVVGDQPFRHVIGFELNEPGRVLKDQRYDSDQRRGEYPLVDWGWTRDACIEFIRSHWDVEWPKSACVYCPFSLQSKVSLARQLELYRQHPRAAVEALYMEEVALALNPSQSLIPGKPLYPALKDAGLQEALSLFRSRLDSTPHAIYEVRRILRGRKDDPAKFANAARSVRAVANGSRLDMVGRIVHYTGSTLEDGYWRAHVRRRGASFPTTEHFFAVAPAEVHDKQHEKFEQWWKEMTDDTA